MHQGESPTTVGCTSPPDGLPRALPAAMGVDALVVGEFLDALEPHGVELHGLVIHRRGHVVLEAFSWPYSADRPRLMHSVTKSFTACAIGMALAERRFALTDKVAGFFPEALPPAPDDKLSAMTVEDLLTMRTGHATETSGALWRGVKSSWIREFFRIPVVHQPGTVYEYTSAASYMLSAILTRTTGETLHDYLRPRLFEPLAITGERWDLGPDGINPGGNGLTCNTIDMLKLGVLHAQGGVWNGRRLLPQAWITTATRAHSASGYGYHWKAAPGRCFCAMGVFGQMAVVYPEHAATLALISATPGTDACSKILLPLLSRYFPRAFRDELREGADADERLLRRTQASANAGSRLVASQSAAKRRGRYEYRIQPNSLGISSLQLTLTADACTLGITDTRGEHTIEVGIGRWIEGESDIPGRDLHHGYDFSPGRVVAGARWTDPDTLDMEWIYVESAFRDTVTCRFSADQLDFSRSVNVNSAAPSHPRLIGRLVLVHRAPAALETPPPVATPNSSR